MSGAPSFVSQDVSNPRDLINLILKHHNHITSVHIKSYQIIHPHPGHGHPPPPRPLGSPGSSWVILGHPGSSWVRGGTASSWWSSAGQEHCSWRPKCISSRSIASVVHGPLASRNAETRSGILGMVLKWRSPNSKFGDISDWFWFRFSEYFILMWGQRWFCLCCFGDPNLSRKKYRENDCSCRVLIGVGLQFDFFVFLHFIDLHRFTSIIIYYSLGVVHAGKQSIVGDIWCHQYPCILAAFGFVWWRVHPRISICMCCMFYSKRPIPLISNNRLATCACPIF